MTDQDILYKLERAHQMGCSDPNDLTKKTMYSEAAAEIRDLRKLLSILSAPFETPPKFKDVIEYEVESVWRGCRCGHPGAGCYCSTQTVRTGRSRTVRQYKTQKSPWE